MNFYQFMTAMVYINSVLANQDDKAQLVRNWNAVIAMTFRRDRVILIETA